ncbi:hypothetical protein KHDHEBDM_00283 [Pectobacterium polaris]|nr:hypothetical protein KHDHEBDM_00283 [Pectobacterium polaris]
MQHIRSPRRPISAHHYAIYTDGSGFFLPLVLRIMWLRYTLKIVVANDMNLNRCCYLLLACAVSGSMLTSYPFAMWFLLVNVLTLVIYGVDKMAARKDWRRVPESTLLVFGVVGGWAGAIAGQQLFRHKTQKQPFKTYFIVSMILSILVMAAVYQLYPFSSS